uniref:Uncharacterized protein n=1 Tax=Anguilla anguilla TaxID=7936 RepID=A0A0E9XA26_ANGAN
MLLRMCRLLRGTEGYIYFPLCLAVAYTFSEASTQDRASGKRNSPTQHSLVRGH